MEQMITSSLSNDLRSHPDKLLKEHLLNVGNYCKNTLSSKKLNMEEYVDFNRLRDIAYIIGVTHDFGKATSYFQDYINESCKEERLKQKNKPETHHGSISSIFTYYAVKEYLRTEKLLDKRYYEYLPAICFLIVKRHHGNLKNVDDEIIDFDEKDDIILEKQVGSIDFGELNEICNFMLSRINSNFDCKRVKDKILNSESVNIYGKQEFLKDYVKDISRKERKLIRNIDEEDTLFFYFVTLLLYSILLDADKKDAARLGEIGRIDIGENIVDEYKKLKFNDKEKKHKKINNIRDEIYKEALSNLECINLDEDRILSLNVPTGTGKTLTALSFAIKLRKRIETEKGYKPRIIYSLPFLSIIDQNFAVFEDVFEIVNEQKPTSEMLLKHHHLSDVVYTSKEDEFENMDKDLGKDLLLIEGWNSEIIVTTFYQLFYSLISNRNRAIRKVHNITNSIIILDEVQAIPHKYWLLLNNTIKFFSTHFNTYFIFITATQPLIFNEYKGEIKALVGRKENYFRELDRVKLNICLESVFIENFKEKLKKDLLENTNKDFLVVLNTISSSKDIYDFINDLGIKKTELFYLSTNLIPKTRLKKINEIREKSKKRKIIVSTQLVEAGVDIDVDIVYRDFAPLDSINQVAGRCNRNFIDKKGIVKIFIIKEEKEKGAYYPRNIYESFLLSKTEEVFKEGKKEIYESEFLKLNENYFEKIDIGKSEDESNRILEKVKKLKFGELSDFKLIEKEYPEVDVFVELDDYAKKTWKKYKTTREEKDPLKRKKEFLKIKKDFYDYVISVPKKYENQVGFDEKTGIGHISKEEIDQGNGYDPETGFKRDNSGGGVMFC